MHSLFYYTGAFVWIGVAVALILTVLYLLWDMLGAIAFTIKVARYVKTQKRVDGVSFKVPSFKDKASFCWKRFLDGTPRVDFVKGERVYRPWPWLSKKHRKRLENEDHFLPG